MSLTRPFFKNALGALKLSQGINNAVLLQNAANLQAQASAGLLAQTNAAQAQNQATQALNAAIAAANPTGGVLNPTPANANRIYIGSLHWDLSEDDIKSVFHTFGKIRAISLMVSFVSFTGLGCT